MRLRMVTLTLCLIGLLSCPVVLSREIRMRRELPKGDDSFHPPIGITSDDARQQGTKFREDYRPPLALPVPLATSQSSYQPPLPQFAPISHPAHQPQSKEKLVEVPHAADRKEQSQPEGRFDAFHNRSKAVGSSYYQSQAIHKAPASEIQARKVSSAKDRDDKKDEYVVYYYYYYDNDTNTNNLTLNFDDIPTLESYDNSKEPQKSASARSIAANVNSLTPSVSEIAKDANKKADTPVNASENASLQPRSASSGNVAIEPEILADKPASDLTDTVIQPLKPVSNVFRYGSNEVPRFPILPNFIVSNVPTEATSEEISTPETTSLSTTFPILLVSSVPSDERLDVDADNDDVNNVLESESKSAAEDQEKNSASIAVTTTTTTTEPPTTTEDITTTTTEKSRRRPASALGGRRRFSPSSAAPPSSRTTRVQDTNSSTKTTAAPDSASTRSSFRSPSLSNRLRPRQPIGSNNRPRSAFSSGRTQENEDTGTPANTTSTTSTRSRLSTTAAPRRFSGSRSSPTRVPTLSTVSTTIASRGRTTSRPRSSLVTRNRPRPGFLRPRPSKEEVVETTTVAAETEPPEENASVPPPNSTENEEENESEAEDEETTTTTEETEEPTTTEKNRFSALFRPRNRNTPGNRPRPVIANRPSRSR